MDTILYSDTVIQSRTKITVQVCETPTGKQYVQLLQIITPNNQPIKESKVVLDEVLLTALLPLFTEAIDTLKVSRAGDEEETVKKPPKLKLVEVEKIISSYLKGVPIKDLARQLGCERSIIEATLAANNIAILSDKDMKTPKSEWNPRRKK